MFKMIKKALGTIAQISIKTFRLYQQYKVNKTYKALKTPIEKAEYFKKIVLSRLRSVSGEQDIAFIQNLMKITNKYGVFHYTPSYLDEIYLEALKLLQFEIAETCYQYGTPYNVEVSGSTVIQHLAMNNHLSGLNFVFNQVEEGSRDTLKYELNKTAKGNRNKSLDLYLGGLLNRAALIENKHLNLLDRFLKNEAQSDRLSEYAVSAFFRASEHNNFGKLFSFLNDLKNKKLSFESTLHIFKRAPFVENAIKWVKLGGSSDIIDEGDRTLLHYAPCYQYGNDVSLLIKELIKAGSSLAAKDRDGKTPLMVAVELKNNHFIVSLLSQLPFRESIPDSDRLIQMALSQYQIQHNKLKLQRGFWNPDKNNVLNDFSKSKDILINLFRDNRLRFSTETWQKLLQDKSLHIDLKRIFPEAFDIFLKEEYRRYREAERKKYEMHNEIARMYERSRALYKLKQASEERNSNEQQEEQPEQVNEPQAEEATVEASWIPRGFKRQRVELIESEPFWISRGLKRQRVEDSSYTLENDPMEIDSESKRAFDDSVIFDPMAIDSDTPHSVGWGYSPSPFSSRFQDVSNGENCEPNSAPRLRLFS